MYGTEVERGLNGPLYDVGDVLLIGWVPANEP